MRFISLLAEPLESGYLRQAESWGLTCDRDPDWRRREERLRRGETEIVALCGLLFSLLRVQGLNLEPVASAVLPHPRYQGRPQYFVDIVARREWTFEDLSGRVVGVNDWNSLSGYHALRAELHRRGHGPEWFGELRATGSHHQSVDQLHSGQIDFACLDSTFWDYLSPERREGLEVCLSLGPFPAPLIASLNGSGSGLKLEPSAEPFLRLVPVSLEDYRPILDLWKASQALDGLC